MKKVIKSKSYLTNEEVTITIDEELNKLKGKVLFPKKLAVANEILRNTKSPLPK